MSEPTRITARLNARLQPMHRGEIFEDPLDESLKGRGLGCVTGGGTQLSASREVEFCDIEIELGTDADQAVETIVQLLERLGAPKGSRLIFSDDRADVVFGATEGVAVYLNGTDLPPETYRNSDANFVYSEFDRLLASDGQVFSYWEGSSETAFYIYGTSFSLMHDKLREFLASYPLCQRCRVVQIA